MQLNKIYGRFVQNKAGSGAVGRLPSRLLWLCRTFSGGGPGTGVGTPAAPAQPGCPSGGRGRAQGVSPEARPGDPRGPEQTDPHRQRPPRGGPVAGVRVPGDGGAGPAADKQGQGRPARAGAARATRSAKREGPEGAAAPGGRAAPHGRPGRGSITRRFRLWVGRSAPRAGRPGPRPGGPRVARGPGRRPTGGP